FRAGVNASGIAVDSAGNAYVTGRTASPDFPVVNALQASFRGGDYDAFVAKLSPDGGALLYSTYLGGAASDSGNGIASDPAGNVYVTGETASGTFPTQNAFQASHGGSSDAFVVGLNASGSALVYGTYLGGAGSDRGNSLAVDPTGKIYVVGDTTSVNFPLLSALQGQNAGGKDAFVAELDPGQAGAASPVYSSYLGGAGDDAGLGITVDSSGEAWITGETGSADWPT